MRRVLVLAALTFLAPGCDGVATGSDGGATGGSGSGATGGGGATGGSGGGATGGGGGATGGGATGGGATGGGATGGGATGGGATGGGATGGGPTGGSGGGTTGGGTGGGTTGGGTGGGATGGGTTGGGSTTDGGFSLRFFGTQRDDIDRVKVRVDTGPANVSGDFTIDVWLKASAADNPLDACSTTNNGTGWIAGNIFIDRDIYGSGDRGDYGLSLNGGRVAFGVEIGNTGATVCGSTPITDGGWHHVAVTRDAASGRLVLFVDGIIDGTDLGPTGDVSYRTGRTTSYPASDPFLTLGAEKHDAVPPGTGYSGFMDEFRLSSRIRYDAGFVPVRSRFSADTSTVLLFHFDEGGGLRVIDSSATANDGVVRDGGNPHGPQWSRDVPF